jgi:hypothetical protein
MAKRNGLLIMGHGRRQVIWFGVTTHPTGRRNAAPYRSSAFVDRMQHCERLDGPKAQEKPEEYGINQNLN